jgi:hypothetical protein
VAKRFIKPRLNRLFTEAVEGLITDLNKRHKFHVVTLSKGACPNCHLDPTTNTSSGTYNGTGPKPFSGKQCPVCRTAGYVTTERKQLITANVQVGTAPDAQGSFVPSPAGKLSPGHAKVKTFAKYQSLVDRASWFLIDGVRYSRHTDPESRGLQTLVTTFFYLKKDV